MIHAQDRTPLPAPCPQEHLHRHANVFARCLCMAPRTGKVRRAKASWKKSSLVHLMASRASKARTWASYGNEMGRTVLIGRRLRLRYSYACSYPHTRGFYPLVLICRGVSHIRHNRRPPVEVPSRKVRYVGRTSYLSSTIMASISMHRQNYEYSYLSADQRLGIAQSPLRCLW